MTLAHAVAGASTKSAAAYKNNHNKCILSTAGMKVRTDFHPRCFFVGIPYYLFYIFHYRWYAEKYVNLNKQYYILLCKINIIKQLLYFIRAET